MQANDIIQQNLLVISLHSNATGEPIDSSMNGVDMYIATKETTFNYADYTNIGASERLGELLLYYISKLGMQSKAVLGGNWFIIREHNIPGLLAENGYHTNDEDRAKLSSPDSLKILSKLYTVAIIDYFLELEE